MFISNRYYNIYFSCYGYLPMICIIEIIDVRNIIDDEKLYNIYRLTNDKIKIRFLIYCFIFKYFILISVR
jgi:hypothetical protein